MYVETNEMGSQTTTATTTTTATIIMETIAKRRAMCVQDVFLID